MCLSGESSRCEKQDRNFEKHKDAKPQREECAGPRIYDVCQGEETLLKKGIVLLPFDT